jgi:hypothetical protein
MTRRELIAFALVTVAMGLLLPVAALAQPFVDDFEDGSATDGNPVQWVPPDPSVDRGTAEVVGGDLLITPSPTALPFPGTDPDYIEVAVLAENRLYQDVSIHTQLRVSGQDPYWVGIMARDTTAMPQLPRVGVWMFLHIDGNSATSLHTGGRTDEGAMPTTRSIPTSLNAHDTDVHMQLDVFGDTASIFAWADGQERPTSPLLTQHLDVSQMVEGNVGLWYGQWRPPLDALNTATFRFVEVVPEPSTTLLAVLGLIGLAAISRRKRR